MPATDNRLRAAVDVRPPASLGELRPGQMAFLGEYESALLGKQVFVQVLCWPAVPTAWGTLAQSHAGLRDLRGAMAVGPAPKGASWLHQVAPQLSQPLERDPATAESTLATLIRRLPIRLAAAVVEIDAAQTLTSGTLRYRDLFAQSLGAYSTHLKEAQQTACRVLIAHEQTGSVGQARRQVYGEILPHLDHAAHVKGMALMGWPGGGVPLPLELAGLAASTVGRHLQDPAAISPLFDAVRGQLVPSLRFPPSGYSKRRR